MKVILISNVDKLGKVGDAIDVTGGYARNFLLAKGLAVLTGDVRAKQAGGERIKKNRVHKQKESKREKRLKRQKSKEI